MERQPANMHESTYRQFNIIGVSIVALTSVVSLSELLFEGGANLIDELLLFIIGISAIVWYSHRDNRYTHSTAPLVFLFIILAIQAIEIFVESVPGRVATLDLLILILLIIASSVMMYEYYKLEWFPDSPP